MRSGASTARRSAPCSVAIRENEQRARFVGYPTNRYKLVAFVVLRGAHGLAGVLLAFHHRMTSADPISVAFSGELLAMVIIGGMRSFLGPALGALFFVIFRDCLSRGTANWLLYFGLLFVGVRRVLARRARGPLAADTAPLRPKLVEPPRWQGARSSTAWRCRPSCARASTRRRRRARGDAVWRRPSAASTRCTASSLAVRDRTLHALIGPNGAGKTTLFNLISGMFAPGRGPVTLAGQLDRGPLAGAITRAGVGRSFQITNLFRRSRSRRTCASRCRRATHRASGSGSTRSATSSVSDRAARGDAHHGPGGHGAAQAGSLSYGGQRLLDMALALATAPRVLLLDEPLAGLAAAERDRVGDLIKSISADMPVLLVEHDIDRVFALADRVTVMNDGEVLVDGSVADARDSRACRRSTSARAPRARRERAAASARTRRCCSTSTGVNTFYGKSHILRT